MKTATASTKAPKTVKLTTPPVISAPAAHNPFGTALAAKAAAVVAVPASGGAIKPPVTPRPVLREQNGRKEYTPGTIGERIWLAAVAIQTATPNTPVQAASVRAALPDVSPASVSAGLSHWRKFNGTLRVKGA